jgi:hypothetical protein
MGFGRLLNIEHQNSVGLFVTPGPLKCFSVRSPEPIEGNAINSTVFGRLKLSGSIAASRGFDGSLTPGDFEQEPADDAANKHPEMPHDGHCTTRPQPETMPG